MKACANDSSNKQGLLPMAPLVACAASDSEVPLRPPRLEQTFVTGSVAGPSGKIPQVLSVLKRLDHWGSIKARWGVGRMHYAVDPGLYALGSPQECSPVLVTANYKMSFDCLREALPGRDAWILVLETEGINVWCAAGKGTFGTEELIRRITASGLKDMVKHRDLILPQLGAPGVAAHLVRKQSGFKVHYGPILARDVAAYLDANLRATAEMRRKAFPLRERAVLIPIEIVATLKPAMIIIPILLLISGFGGEEGFLRNIAHDGIFSLLAFLCAILSGAVLTPLLLPYLPGRAFTSKGIAVGLPLAMVLLYAWGPDLRSWRNILFGGAWLLLIPALSAYLAMNFTGASTYTSLSGVKREMRWALPLEIGAGLSGFATLLASRFF
ncbi:MAG: acetyl-CoA synthase subunit gamma [Syntrophales bacterium]|nr:acetyl-CoA synthase subunit gamma [Syntrophales bacterium]MCK9391334.1 acetyl-CoA synthase subunit gamma [Syntrophales bacterium]